VSSRGTGEATTSGIASRIHPECGERSNIRVGSAVALLFGSRGTRMKERISV